MKEWRSLRNNLKFVKKLAFLNLSYSTLRTEKHVDKHNHIIMNLLSLSITGLCKQWKENVEAMNSTKSPNEGDF